MTMCPRAVAYVRASTEMQQYSTKNQLGEIAKYAAANGIQIVDVYEDHARSGLTLDRRDALKRLLSDVLRPDRGFDEVLVYDITRWGRFQDSDQAAYHEYHCRMHGAPVRYTMDPFINNGTPMAALMKAVQRVSAADYSRTLSLKVIAGFARLAKGKFALGSGAPFGYRRQIVDPNGIPGIVLKRGERKAIQSCNVTLIHGPEDEVAWARRIFERYAGTPSSLADLVLKLREEGVVAHTGGQFTPEIIRHMLSNPVYLGNHVWGKTQKRLKGPTVKVPQAEWILRENISVPMISQDLFDRCAKKLKRRAGFIRSDETMISELEAALTRNPLLLPAQFADEGLSHPHVYCRRFGSTGAAYKAAGFEKACGVGYDRRSHTLGLTRDFRESICTMLESTGRHTATPLGRGRSIVVNGCWQLQLQILPATMRNTSLYWRINKDGPWAPYHFMVAGRTLEDDTLLDYYVVPAGHMNSMPQRLKFRNAQSIDRFRFDSTTRLATIVP